MYDGLIIYEGILKPFDLEVVLDLEKAFDSIGYAEHQLEVSEIENLNEAAMTHFDKGQMVLAAYQKHAELLLTAMGVYLTDDDQLITAGARRDILLALLATEDPDNIDILESQLGEKVEDNRDALAELLAQLSDQTVSYFILRIEEVDAALLARIRKNAGSHDLFGDVMETVNATRDEFRRYIQHYGRGPVAEHVIAVNQLPVNYNNTLATIADQLTQLPVDKLATELYAMSIVAAIPADARLDLALSSRQELLDGPRGLPADNRLVTIDKEFRNA